MSERYVALSSGKGFGVFDTVRDVWVIKNGPENEVRASAAKYNAELETKRTTPNGETITTREVARYRYFVTLRPNSNGRGNIGPAIAEVVISSHSSDKRPRIADTYRVHIDGVSAYGGFADHLNGDPATALTSFAGSPVEIVSDDEANERETDTAVDWLMAVRKFGLERANEMFPEG